LRIWCRRQKAAIFSAGKKGLVSPMVLPVFWLPLILAGAEDAAKHSGAPPPSILGCGCPHYLQTVRHRNLPRAPVYQNGPVASSPLRRGWVRYRNVLHGVSFLGGGRTPVKLPPHSPRSTRAIVLRETYQKVLIGKGHLPKSPARRAGPTKKTSWDRERLFRNASAGAGPAPISPENVAPDAPATRKPRLPGRHRFGLRRCKADRAAICVAAGQTGRQFASLESGQGANLRRAEGAISPLAGAKRGVYWYTRKTGVWTLPVVRKTVTLPDRRRQGGLRPGGRRKKEVRASGGVQVFATRNGARRAFVPVDKRARPPFLVRGYAEPLSKLSGELAIT
jgi:hypothetical protein